MICNICNIEKGDDFRKGMRFCRECHNAKARAKRLEDKNRKKPDTITCNKCGVVTSNFRVNRGACIPCEREHGRAYRRNTTKAKEWATANPERMSELQHSWYSKQKGVIREKVKDRIKSDPNFKLARDHRAALRSLVKGGKTSKYVNCDGERLRNWMQVQLEGDLTLKDHGSLWVFDHVIPIDTFLSGIHPENCVLNWRNVRPIPKHDNLKKNKHFTIEECRKHFETVSAYDSLRRLEQDEEYMEVLKSICEHCETPRCGDTLRASDNDPLLETAEGELG